MFEIEESIGEDYTQCEAFGCTLLSYDKCPTSNCALVNITCPTFNDERIYASNISGQSAISTWILWLKS
jgi:hypothetical protein